MPVTQEDLDNLGDFIAAIDQIAVDELDYEGFDPEYTRAQIKASGDYDKKSVATCIAAYLKRGTRCCEMRWRPWA